MADTTVTMSDVLAAVADGIKVVADTMCSRGLPGMADVLRNAAEELRAKATPVEAVTKPKYAVEQHFVTQAAPDAVRVIGSIWTDSCGLSTYRDTNGESVREADIVPIRPPPSEKAVWRLPCKGGTHWGQGGALCNAVPYNWLASTDADDWFGRRWCMPPLRLTGWELLRAVAGKSGAVVRIKATGQRVALIPTPTGLLAQALDHLERCVRDTQADWSNCFGGISPEDISAETVEVLLPAEEEAKP